MTSPAISTPDQRLRVFTCIPADLAVQQLHQMR